LKRISKRKGATLLARDYLPEVRGRHGDVPELAYWIGIMCPPTGRIVKSDRPTRDLLRDFEWIKANAHAYYGEWLAIYEDSLLAHGPDMEIVRAEGREKSPSPDFLMFHAVGMPS
jgi:hypothetical protein